MRTGRTVAYAAICFFAITGAARARVEVFIGPQIGYGSSGLWSRDSLFGHKDLMGGCAGLVCRVGLGNYAAINTGMLIDQKGYDVRQTFVSTLYDIGMVGGPVSLDYLDLRLGVEARFPLSRVVVPFVHAGISLNMLLKSVPAYYQGVYSSYDSLSFDSHDVSVPVGGGIQFALKQSIVGIDACYDPGIHSIFRQTEYSVEPDALPGGISRIVVTDVPVYTTCWRISVFWLVKWKAA